MESEGVFVSINDSLYILRIVEGGGFLVEKMKIYCILIYRAIHRQK
jgi:hypothetical protein